MVDETPAKLIRLCDRCEDESKEATNKKLTVIAYQGWKQLYYCDDCFKIVNQPTLNRHARRELAKIEKKEAKIEQRRAAKKAVRTVQDGTSDHGDGLLYTRTDDVADKLPDLSLLRTGSALENAGTDRVDQEELVS